TRAVEAESFLEGALFECAGRDGEMLPQPRKVHETQVHRLHFLLAYQSQYFFGGHMPGSPERGSEYSKESRTSSRGLGEVHDSYQGGVELQKRHTLRVDIRPRVGARNQKKRARGGG